MGTTYTIKYRHPEKVKITPKQIKESIRHIFLDVNDKMSTYIPTSELSKINNSKRASAWTPISKELFFILSRSKEISRKSDKSFDPTIGPLVNLWGFGPKKHKMIPSPSEITNLIKETGTHLYHLKTSPPSIKKINPKLYIDLSAIAKGHSVDLVAKYFNSVSVKNYMIEVGGEIIVKGQKSEKKPWAIGITSPGPKLSVIHRVVLLKNTAMATSGNYRNYFEKNGKRFSHTIDPKTGRPITHKLASATVFDETCLDADAWATAFMVMGAKKAKNFANNHNIKALFLVKDDSSSGGFREILSKPLKLSLQTGEIKGI